jgi:hypothetical protein
MNLEEVNHATNNNIPSDSSNVIRLFNRKKTSTTNGNSLSDLQMARQSKQQRRSCQGTSELPSSNHNLHHHHNLHPNYHSSNYQLKNVTKCKLRTHNNIDNDDEEEDEEEMEENGEDMEPHFYYDENEFDEVFDHGGSGGGVGCGDVNESHQCPPRYSLLQQQKPLQTAINNKG